MTATHPVASPPAPRPPFEAGRSADPEPTTGEIIELFGTLRWRTFRGALRSTGALRWTVIVGLVASVLLGVVAGIGFAVGGHRVDDPQAMFTIGVFVLAVGVMVVGVVAGVSQPVDPRVLATEPLRDRQLGLGLLVGSAVGPPGLSALLIGIGLFVGSVDSVAAVIPAALAAGAALVTLLLLSRTTINLLGLFTTRTPRAGQAVVGLVSLAFYAGFQIVPTLLFDLTSEQQQTIADVVRWTPPGQIGAALGRAGDAPFEAVGRVALGSLWLPVLAWAFAVSTRHLLGATRLAGSKHLRGGGALGPDGGRRNVGRRLCGNDEVGAVAWRSIRTRLRTPRSALETVMAGGIGLAVVLVPALVRDQAGAGAVLVGGAVQLTVLFMAGNCFGSDGPALANEMLCGVDPEVIVRGTARSVMIVASPIAVIGPVAAAAITGEWNYIVAGFLIAAGGLFAGAGAAMVQSVHAPIAIPESDNPLAGGDTGKGCFAGLILAAILVVVALITLPIALGLLWAVDRGSTPFVSVLAVTTLGAGWLIHEGGVRHATRVWRRNEPEIYGAIIAAR